MSPIILDLDTLGVQIPTIPPESAGFFKQNCMVCMDSQGHASGVTIDVETNEQTETASVIWSGDVTPQLYKAYGNDEKRTTDNGAVAIALLIVREMTPYTAVEQAGLGTTIDYFLSTKTDDDTLIFNNTEAYLEVRGIRAENEGNTVQSAVTRKLKRLNPPQTLPTYIIVVEFSQPKARVSHVYRA